MAVSNRQVLARIVERIHIDRLLIRKKIRDIQGRVSGVLLDVDLTEFPYPPDEASADWILCTQVLDDLPDQDAFLKELHRLLAPQGGLILSASFVWELHDLPHDYGRPSPERLRLLLEQNGFAPVELQHLGNSWTTLGQIININLLNIMSKRSWWFKLISPLLLLNSMFFYAAGLLCGNEESGKLPLAFFVVARKK
jgi:SAM-dependent methyltransferase